jgi:hypothetical protein
MTFTACSELRFSKVTPGAENFHPQRVGIVQVDTGHYEEAEGKVEQLIAEVLLKKKWFTGIVTAASYKKLSSSGEFEKYAADYFTKLKTVNYSDPDLSRKIGELWNVEGLLLVTVEYWNYTQENGEQVAKVSLGMKMIETRTGNIVWQAAHHIVKNYTFLKPALDDVAKKVAKEMLRDMPH